MWVGHDSFISNGRVIYSFESLIILKQPSRNMRGRQIHLFTKDGNIVYIWVRWSLGNTNQNLAFKYGPETTAFRGCGASLNGEFWYFGGGSFTYSNVSLSLFDFRIYNLLLTFFQTVSKIVGCQLVKQTNMAFDLFYPACNTFLEPDPKVLLCFSSSGSHKACHS